MKRTITVMCGWLLAIAACAQFNERDRLVSINPLRNGDGSFVKANNPLYFNNSSTDTTLARKRVATTSGTVNDPFAFRINSVQAMCDLNSLQLNWTGIQQQSDADHFDIEQSSDNGINWTSIGIVPAARSKIGQVPYSFSYNKSLGNVDLRVVAVNTAGERRYSSIVHSACSNINLFSADNLVYSTAHIRIGSATTQNIKMILTNQSGLAVQAREAGLTKGVNSISLDMSSLPQGYYILTVIWPGGNQQSVKIMKQ
jgi:hypothetical protein